MRNARPNARRRSNNTADSTSLVDDKNAISMDDVMSYAGGLRPSFGAAADTTSKNVAKVGGVDGSSKNSGSDSSFSADSMSSSLPVAGYGLAKTGFTPDNGDLIDETVELAAAAEVFDDALQAGLGGKRFRKFVHWPAVPPVRSGAVEHAVCAMR